MSDATFGAERLVQADEGKAWRNYNYPTKTGTTLYSGLLVAHQPGTRYIEEPIGASGADDMVVIGVIATPGCSWVSGSNGAYTLPILSGCLGPFENSASGDLIDEDDVDSVVYAVNGGKLALTSDTNKRPIAGILRYIDSNGGLWIDCDPVQNQTLYQAALAATLP